MSNRNVGSFKMIGGKVCRNNLIYKNHKVEATTLSSKGMVNAMSAFNTISERLTRSSTFIYIFYY